MIKAIPKDIKEQILAEVKEGKDSVANIARRYAVKGNTIYNWVSRGFNSVNISPLDIGRIKRENQMLKQIIGKFVLEKERGKKDKPYG
jgi:transposase-like protein